MKKQSFSNKINVLVFTTWSFYDALIQTYTLPYLKLIKKQLPEGSSIHFITLEQSGQRKSAAPTEDYTWFTLPYHRFGAKAFIHWIYSLYQIKKYIQKNKINVFHSWCTPAGMIAWFFHRKNRTFFIADSFEPHAHSMVENGTWKSNSIAFKLLKHFEKKIIQNADEIITIAPGMEHFMKQNYGLNRKIIYVKPAAVNLGTFSILNRKNDSLIQKYQLEDKTVMVYAGKFGGIYLNDEIFDFCNVCFQHWNDKIRFLFLTSEQKELLLHKAKERNIPEKNFIIEFVPHDQIANMMGLADFALCPVKPVPSKKYCSPIKTGEYWALGLPVIIPSNISNDSEIIAQNNAGYVWKEISEKEFLNSIHFIEELISKNSIQNLYAQIRPLAEKYRNFSNAENIYQSIYSKLTSN